MNGRMKLLCALLIFALLSPFAMAEDETDQLKADFETFVLGAIEMLGKFAIDQSRMSNLAAYFEKDAPSMQNLGMFDGGLYPKVRKYEFTDQYADDWQKVSETEFAVSAHATMSVRFRDKDITEIYECNYRFHVRYDKIRNQWRIYDFEALPNSRDAETVARLNELRPDVHFYAVTGKLFCGYLMVVDDPVNVFVGTCEYFGDNCKGLRVNEMSDKYHAFAVVNGGGFSDDMRGGRPHGIVVTQGVVRMKHDPGTTAFATVVGLTEDNEMVIGNFSRDEVDALRLRDAVAFSPLLIKNGVIQNGDTRSIHKQFTIRSSVGHDADGRAMFLIAKGRQPDSLGATVRDVTDVLFSYGAVDAANLDGGTSSALYVNGEVVYSGYRLMASRPIPTAFIIAGQ